MPRRLAMDATSLVKSCREIGFEHSVLLSLVLPNVIIFFKWRMWVLETLGRLTKSSFCSIGGASSMAVLISLL